MSNIKTHQNFPEHLRKTIRRQPEPCLDCGTTNPGPRRRARCHACYKKALRAGALLPRRIKKPEHHTFGQWFGIEEIQLLREVCRRDFWTFFLYAFGDGLSPKGQGWIDPAVHEPMARWFQQHAEEWMANRHTTRDQKHLAILVHREMGKTRMFSGAGQLWLHLRDPELSSYTGSESLQLSAKILSIMRGVLDGTDPFAMFTRLYGNWSTSARQWTGTSVTHAARKQTSRADPSLGTFAVETSITGAHPDAIFYDDPISYERMLTDANWLGMVNSQVSSLYPVVQSDGLVVWVGTRYDDDDHFGVAFRDEGIASISGMKTDALEANAGGKWHVYFLAGRDEDSKPSTPKVWPERRLADYQRRDPLRYASQVMNDPAISEFNPLTKDQIKQCLVKSSDVPWGSLVYGICTDIAFWDGKSRERKDDTVMVVHGYPRNGSGDVYIVEVHGSPTWRAEDFGHRLVALVQRYRSQGRRIIGISADLQVAGAKGAWPIALRNMFHDVGIPMPTYYEFSRAGAKERKVERMITAAAFWVDGHVKVVEGAPGVQLLMDQMAKIGQYMVNPRMKNDFADAHSDAFREEFYQPMRKMRQGHPPYESGARAFELQGLDPADFDDSGEAEWNRECPREPIR